MPGQVVVMAPKAKAKAQVDPKAKAKATATAKAGVKAKALARADPKAKAAGRVEPKAKAVGRADPKAKATSRVDPKAKATARVDPKAVAPKRGAADVAPKRKASGELKATPPKKAKTGSPGGRVVDSLVPGKENFTVHEDFTVKLNQTHIDANNNKYYIIQVLEKDGEFWTWNRWGRVGEPGQNKLLNCHSLVGAQKEFEKKFREKTQNPWVNRASFKPVNGKYTIVETEETAGGDDQAPMGKLSEAQIGKGQKVLDKLGITLKTKSGNIDELSSEFYSLIPHKFGRQVPKPINTDALLNEKMELLKFYLRMGFDQVDTGADLSPVDGIMALPLPTSLDDAAGHLCGKTDIKESNEKGSQFCSRQAGNPVQPMEAKHYAAIMLYTSNAIYKDLNQVLRDKNRNKIKKYFKYLRLLLDALNTLPKKKTRLWRGVSVDLFDEYAPGKEITWWNVSSCTADIKVAKEFMNGCGGNCTLFTVESNRASDISEITFFSNEKESLLSPGVVLKVKDRNVTAKFQRLRWRRLAILSIRSCL